MPASKTCPKCAVDDVTDAANCQRCGGRLQKRSTIRILGAIMILLGGSLAAAMVALGFWAFDLINSSNSPRTGTRFTGDRGDMLFMFGLFAVVFTFGIASITAGLWQVLFGRRNKVLISAVLGLGLLFFLTGLSVALMK